MMCLAGEAGTLTSESNMALAYKTLKLKDEILQEMKEQNAG
jgi:hypothetical protein